MGSEISSESYSKNFFIEISEGSSECSTLSRFGNGRSSELSTGSTIASGSSSTYWDGSHNSLERSTASSNVGGREDSSGSRIVQYSPTTRYQEIDEDGYCRPIVLPNRPLASSARLLTAADPREIRGDNKNLPAPSRNYTNLTPSRPPLPPRPTLRPSLRLAQPPRQDLPRSSADRSRLNQTCPAGNVLPDLLPNVRESTRNNIKSIFIIDWECPFCSFVNLDSTQVCRSCSTEVKEESKKYKFFSERGQLPSSIPEN